jgi:hypothetical protein
MHGLIVSGSEFYEYHRKQHSRRASARLAARAGVLPERRCYRLDTAGQRR